MRRLLACLVAALCLAAPAAAAACPKTTLGDVENEVMCPVCGTPLSLATESPQAQRERALIQRLIDRCKSKDEVKDTLVAQFGDDVLALPGSGGFDLAAYLVPALAILLAGGAVAASALRWRRRRRCSWMNDPPADGPSGGTAGVREPIGPTPAPDGAAAKRLQSDLERYEL